MTRTRSVVVLALAVSLLAVAAPAVSAGPRVPEAVLGGSFSPAARPVLPTTGRFSILRRDPNDAKGPLDFAYVRASRGGPKDLLTWGMLGSVTNKQLDPNNGNFAVGIDTNNDRKWDFFQYGFFAAGRLRGVLVNAHSNRVVSRRIPTSRRGPKTFAQNVLLAKIGNPGTYRFALFSYFQAMPCSKKRACGDAIPNRYPLLPLDHAAPSLRKILVDDHSTDYLYSKLQGRVWFTTKDEAHGTGLKNWMVEARVSGTSAWTVVKSGTLESPRVGAPGTEGGSYEVRIVSTDNQNNSTVSSVYPILFPYDDPTGIVYVSGSTFPSLATFLGSYTSVTQSGTATITFSSGASSGSICLLLMMSPFGTRTAAATLDGIVQADATESTATPHRDRSTCYGFNGASPHTLVLTVTSVDPFLLDGYYVEP